MTTTIATEMAAAIRDHGSRQVFGLIGEGNMILVNAITDTGSVSFVGSRHETAAVGMADGYARSTGELGIASVTQGPGATNTITALITAARACSPLLLLAPEVPDDVAWHIQKLNLAALAASLDLTCVTLDLSRPREMLLDCLRWASEAHQPLIVRFPYPELDAEPWATYGGGTDRLPPPRPATPPAPPEDVRTAAEFLAASRRPVIIAGHGVRLSGATDAIISLAETAGAALATSLMGHGLFAGHPQDLGISGGFSRAETRAVMGQTDCVLVFGASLNQFTTHHGHIVPESAHLIHCDIDPSHVNRITEVDHAVIGDALATAQEIERVFLELGESRTFAGPTPLGQAGPVQDVEPGSGVLNPDRLMFELNKKLPTNRVVVVEGGHNMGFVARNMDVSGPRDFFVPIEFGSIGLAMGLGTGTAFGRPDATSVITIGDGSLLMSLGELETLCRYDVPAIVIVLDDGSYAAEYHALDIRGVNLEHSLYPRRDFAAAARSFGAQAHTVRSPEDVLALPDLTKGVDGPVVLDCKIDLTIRGDWLGA